MKVFPKKLGVVGDGATKTRLSASSNAARYYNEQKENKKTAALESSMGAEIRSQKISDSLSRNSLRKASEAQVFRAGERLYQEGKNILFKDMVFEAFSTGLVLDEEAILEHEDGLRQEVNSFVEERGGWALLENAIKETNSPFLKKMKAICESTAREVSARKMKEMGKLAEDTSTVTFALDQKEKEEYTYDKLACGLDQVGGLIKEKVLNTVIAEKEREKENEEFENELNDIQKDTEDDKGNPIDEAGDPIDDGSGVNESTSIFGSIFDEKLDTVTESMLVGDDEKVSLPKLMIVDELKGVQESTLFTALLRTAVTEGVAARVNSSTQDIIDDSSEDDVEYPDENPIFTHRSSLARIMGYRDRTIRDEIKSYPLAPDNIDMDLLMAEGIANYTLLETFNTLRLEKYNPRDLKESIHRMINK